MDNKKIEVFNNDSSKYYWNRTSQSRIIYSNFPVFYPKEILKDGKLVYTDKNVADIISSFEIQSPISFFKKEENEAMLELLDLNGVD